MVNLFSRVFWLSAGLFLNSANIFAAQKLPSPTDAPALESGFDRFFRAVDEGNITNQDEAMEVFNSPSAQESFTITTLWTRIGIWVNWITALLGVAALIFLLYGAYLYMSAG